MLLAPLFLSLLPLVSAVYTPKSRHIHARHAAIINARAPAPAPAPVPVPPLALKKRSSKKCRPRPSSSSLAPSSSPLAPVNPGSNPTQTSEHQQPTQPPPPPPPTHKPSPTTTAHPQTTTHPSGGGGGGGSAGGSGGGSDPFGGFHAGTNVGDVTFYELGLTACGQTYSDGDLVAAASQLLFDKVPGQNGNPNDNPVCGKRVNVHLNGQTVNVAIVDRCVACAANDLDLSPTAFQRLASLSVGRAHGATWEWA